MDVIAKSEIVCGIGKLLKAHGGGDTLVLDVRENCGWTEYFIITTAKSQGHFKGLLKGLHEYLDERQIKTARRAKEVEHGGWSLIDGGFFVIHIMSRDCRSFYELEKLWFSSKSLFEEPAKVQGK